MVALLSAAARADKILLVPLDSRPAAGQFAQMIAKISGEDLRMPPYASLGRFTDPGRPEEVLQWLSTQELNGVSTMVVSADMICYGGLIASRTHQASDELAKLRLQKLLEIRRRRPKTKLYVFSSTMRLTPTATRPASRYRLILAKYMELRDMWQRGKVAKAKEEMERLRPQIPTSAMEDYERARARDHAVQREMVKAAANGLIDYLVIGQDDAKPFGPHIGETLRLRQLVKSLKAESRVYFCEGIDQHASVLVSRALLRQAGWVPRVRVAYSDPDGKRKFANYESKPIEESLNDQIIASGGRPVPDGEEYDYTLYLNTPKRRDETFREWLDGLKSELDQGFPVAVADINFAADATADPELFEALWQEARMMKLLSFAGWNTAGNTMGTAVPAANVYLLARRLNVDPVLREVAQREFLLHRFVNDYAYHKFTRPVAYGMVLSTNRDEIYGLDFTDLNDFVQRDLQKHLERYFDGQFNGRRFFAGNEQYAFSGIEDIKVWLPWPRAYEVRLQFQLKAKPVVDGR